MKIVKIVLVLAILIAVLYIAYIKFVKKPAVVAPPASVINDSAECQAMKDTYGIIPGKTWGKAAEITEVIGKWTSMGCYAAKNTVNSRPLPNGIMQEATVNIGALG